MSCSQASTAVVTRHPRHQNLRAALSNLFGFRGQNVSLLFAPDCSAMTTCGTRRWARDAQAWPTAAEAHTCPLHDGRVACLLASARRALTAGILTPERMRQRVQAVAGDRGTTVAEQWQLRDAGRDTYTSAEDALSQLLPAAHRLNDVLAGMLTAGGTQLQLATGPIAVAPHMRKVLRRQRTSSILCNGPADWPLLTLFDRYVTGRR